MSSVRGAIKRVRSAPSEVAAQLARTALLGGVLERRYRVALETHAPRLPPLPPASARIVEDLRQSGVAALSVEALGLGSAERAMQQARRVYSEQAGAFAASIALGTDYAIAAADAMARRPEIFRFGLEEKLLDIVEAYLGLPPGYDGVVLQYTPADGRSASTRLWHRDREDRTMLKVALYLNDVGPDDGPFELVPDAAAGAAEDSGEAPICCVGPAGTIVFADTARYLHRGRPISGRPRLALFFSYFARRPRDPWFCVRTGITRAQLRTLTAGLSSRQRAAATWRQTLPLLARLVPPAPLV